jgi:hypothetical protein
VSATGLLASAVELCLDGTLALPPTASLPNCSCQSSESPCSSRLLERCVQQQPEGCFAPLFAALPRLHLSCGSSSDLRYQ